MSALIGDDVASFQREKVMIGIANLTLRQALNFNELFAFQKSIGDVHLEMLKDLRVLDGSTDGLITKANSFSDHSPLDAGIFRATAHSLVQQIAGLNQWVAKDGSELEVLALEESERLERRSSSYGHWIRTLPIYQGFNGNSS